MVSNSKQISWFLRLGIYMNWMGAGRGGGGEGVGEERTEWEELQREETLRISS